jgi:hypothetical protein
MTLPFRAAAGGETPITRSVGPEYVQPGAIDGAQIA